MFGADDAAEASGVARVRCRVPAITYTASRRDTKRLSILNWVMCALHAALTLSAVISAADSGMTSGPVFLPRAQWNMTACALAGHGTGVRICPADGAPENVGSVSLTTVLVVSQSITSVFHAAQALQARYWGSVYVQWSILRGVKVWHWVEYILTASLIAHVTLYLSGALSIRTQLLGYAAQSTLMLVGLLQDLLRHSVRYAIMGINLARGLLIAAFVVGFYNVASLWAPALYELFVDAGGNTPPEFVKWVVLSEFVLYTSFGLAQLCFFTPFIVFGGSYTPRFVAEELVFTTLSLVSKAVLATAFSVCIVYNQCGGD